MSIVPKTAIHLPKEMWDEIYKFCGFKEKSALCKLGPFRDSKQALFDKLERSLHFQQPQHHLSSNGHILMLNIGNKFVLRRRFAAGLVGRRRQRAGRRSHQRDVVWQKLMKTVNGSLQYIDKTEAPF